MGALISLPDGHNVWTLYADTIDLVRMGWFDDPTLLVAFCADSCTHDIGCSNSNVGECPAYCYESVCSHGGGDGSDESAGR